MAQKVAYIIVSDTAMLSGGKIEIENRTQIYYQSKKFNSDVVSEFQLKDGQKFLSRLIDGFENPIFCEVNEESSHILLRPIGSKDVLFLDSKADSFQLNKNNFKQILKDFFPHCEKFPNAIKNLTFSFLNINRYLKNVLNDRCLPTRKLNYGLEVGLSKTKVELIDLPFYNKELGKFNLSKKITRVSFFTEHHIAGSNYFSVLNRISYFNFSNSKEFSQEQFEADISLNFNILELGIQLKYTLPFRKIRPYISSGYSVQRITNLSSKIFLATIDNSIVHFSEFNNSISLNEVNPSILTELGVEIYLFKRSFLTASLRFENEIFMLNSSISAHTFQIQIHI